MNQNNGQQGGQQRRSFKREWKRVHMIDDGPMAITIEKSNDYRPKYSVTVGRVIQFAKDGEQTTKFVPTIQMPIEGKGKVTVATAGMVETMASLFERATAWIREDAQHAEDVYIQNQIAREARQMSRERPRERHGLKTLSRIDAAVRTAAEDVGSDATDDHQRSAG